MNIPFGDMVHWAAQPIAQLIDRGFGTNLQTCQSCADRRDRWNQWGTGWFETRKETNMSEYLVTVTKVVEADSPEEAIGKHKDVPSINVAAMLKVPPQAPGQPPGTQNMGRPAGVTTGSATAPTK